MSKFKLSTPVAFIIFNRPDLTEKVFHEIAKAKPTRLFIIGDGPRADHAGEYERVADTREIIRRVDWDCEVITNFSESNLGCKQRVSSGIDWVFEQTAEAIFLEDDCLPDPTFFRFCQELLYYYRHDQRIGMISGDNFQFGNRRSEYSYYFSKYFHIWGWASWRDRWAMSYDVNMSKWPSFRDEGLLADMIGEKGEAIYWKNSFDRVYQGTIDTWDYQWLFANWVERRLSIAPAVNLVSNIGYGENGTHTKSGSVFSDMKIDEICFPLKHPLFIERNSAADIFTAKIMFCIPLWKRIAMNIRNLLVEKKL